MFSEGIKREHWEEVCQIFLLQVLGGFVIERLLSCGDFSTFQILKNIEVSVIKNKALYYFSYHFYYFMFYNDTPILKDSN